MATACGNITATDSVVKSDTATTPADSVTDISTPVTSSETDYSLYAMLGKCAEMVYYTSAIPATTDDSLRYRHLTHALLASGLTPASMMSTQTAREIDSIVADGQSSASGFKASVFYSEPLHTYVLAFAGTEPEAADIITDIQGAFSIEEPQNKAALTTTESIAKLVKAYDPDARILLTGHSLGGRLASIASIICGIDAVAFNPANIPIDLHKQIIDSPRLAQNAEQHLRRIHSSADELTSVMNIGQSLRQFIPLISSLMDTGSEWLADTTSLSSVKSVISSLPEIAQATDALIDIFSSGKSPNSHDSKTRIALALIKNMRRYHINADDLQNPLFYRYAGRRVTPTPAHGPHAIAPLNAALDSLIQ
ncbi:MAG: DUF2974 domain-containing protein [Paramuribaculum sp.]|nr:DUF2974 domain-containing protein [Paramuribaculum sp.]